MTLFDLSINAVFKMLVRNEIKYSVLINLNDNILEEIDRKLYRYYIKKHKKKFINCLAEIELTNNCSLFLDKDTFDLYKFYNEYFSICYKYGYRKDKVNENLDTDYESDEEYNKCNLEIDLDLKLYNFFMTNII
tara:strand:+ start:162 stop:563 length:402 start_codon:yes stop_codon:yes gene_type:complete